MGSPRPAPGCRCPVGPAVPATRGTAGTVGPTGCVRGAVPAQVKSALLCPHRGMSEIFTLDNGDGLYLDEYGTAGHASGNCPALVCVHGLGGGGYFFAGIGHALAAGGGHVLCPDLPGSGFSPRGDQAVTFDR